MIPRKPVRDSMPQTTYQPIRLSDSSTMDHVESSPSPLPSPTPNLSGKGERDSLNPTEHAQRPPLLHLNEKSKNSWRTRLIGGGKTSNVTEHELNSSSSFLTNEPLEDRETHFTLLDENARRQLGKNFHPPRQLVSLLIGGFINWFLTATMSAILAAVMYVYSSKNKTLSDHDKSVYNFLIIGISLALGMNIGSSLKAMASDARWWVLSLRRRSLKEVDLILRLDSLTCLTKLAFTAPRLAPFCFAWILLNLVSQIGLALLGLTYSPDSVTDKALISYGNVTVADLSTLYTESHLAGSTGTESLDDKQYTANNYGNIALSLYSNDTNHLPEPNTLWRPNSPIMFVDAVNREFIEYVFMETNYDSLEKISKADSSDIAPTVFTNRSLETTWSCQSWAVLEGGNGTSTNLTIALDSSGTKSHFGLWEAPGLYQTTFLVNSVSQPSCGAGCTTIYAFEAQEIEAWLYECNMTVSDVGNATLPEHKIGDQLKSLAGQGIALQGHVRNEDQASSGWQYQIYPDTSVYGTAQDGDADSKGLIIAYFTTGVIAAAASANQQLIVLGGVPEVGSQLQVEWMFVELILGLTVGIQFLLFVAIAFISNLVIVKDESPFSTARLLRPLLDRLGPGGTYAEGEQLIKLLQDEEVDKVVYSVRHPEKGSLHHLDLGHQKRLRAFPRGDYD